MKKIYLSAAALLACAFLNAQSAFTWDVVSYKGAFPITDGTPATNWASGWTEWNPEVKVYPAPTTTVTGNITSNTTWSGVVYLDGFVHVINNAELTILPGTIIRGKQTDISVTPGVLVIARGSKIHATGTPSQPIIFTSIKSETAGRASGDWGGVVLCGKGIVNLHTLTTPAVGFKEMKVEGFVTDEPNGYRHFGGTDANDNSGEMSYVRIEFAGVSLNPSILNNEINGLTLGAVGRGTKLDHIQVSFSGDDSFEWFGGSVDAKYLIANRGKDDDFDTDNGFSGRVQFGLAIKDPYIADDSDPSYASNGFECDNNGVGSYYGLPLTKAVFSNMTMVGPYGDGTAYGTPLSSVNARHAAAAHLRRNMAQSVFNSLFVGWKQGLRYQQASTLDNINSSVADSACAFQKNVITDFSATSGTLTVNQTTFVNDGATFPQTWYNAYAAANSIDTVTTPSQINFVNAFTALGNTPDYRLNTASTQTAGAVFTNTIFGASCSGTPSSASAVISNSASCVASTFTLNATGTSSLVGVANQWKSALAVAGPYTNISGANQPSYVATASVTTYYQLASSCAFSSLSANSNTLTFTKNDGPVVSVNSGSICLGQSFTMTPSGATTYTFSNGGSVVTPTATANYTVIGVGSNGCVSPIPAVSSVTVNTCLGVNELVNTLNVIVYPNPSNGLFFVDLQASTKVIVTNSLGQIVFNELLNEGLQNIDIKNQSTGIYFVKLIQNNKQLTVKLIKE